MWAAVAGVGLATPSVGHVLLAVAAVIAVGRRNVPARAPCSTHGPGYSDTVTRAAERLRWQPAYHPASTSTPVTWKYRAAWSMWRSLV